MPGTLLACYDRDLDAFADLAGDFDFLDSGERERWMIAQWMQMAQATGWAGDLEATLTSLQRSRVGLDRLDEAALATFGRVFDRAQEDAARADRAKVRQDVLLAIEQRQPANLWRVELDVGPLPGGACYGRMSWRPRPPAALQGLVPAAGVQGQGRPASEPAGEVVTLPERAFSADAAPSYFWTPTPTLVQHQLGCGWQTPIRLSLGTFPWVYGNRLHAQAPALGWRPSGALRPAVVARRIAAALASPLGNLRQDARDVAGAWTQWRATTAPLLAALPPWPTTGPRSSGTTYRRGLLLVAEGLREDAAGLNGPRGFVSLAAFNFIQRRFAAFFTLRRALLRARSRLTPELKATLVQNPDPCVRQQLGLDLLQLQRA